MFFKTNESRETTQECLKAHRRASAVPTKRGPRPYCNAFLYWWTGWSPHFLYGRADRHSGMKPGRLSIVDIDIMTWFQLLKDSVEQMPDEKLKGRKVPIYQV